MFDVIGDGSEIPLHSEEFKQRAALEFAYNQAMRAGAAVALTAAKVLSDQNLRNKIQKEFRGKFVRFPKFRKHLDVRTFMVHFRHAKPVCKHLFHLTCRGARSRVFGKHPVKQGKKRGAAFFSDPYV